MKKILLTLAVMTAFTTVVYASAVSDYEAGKKALDEKNYESAVEYLQKAVKEDSKYAEAYNALGEAQMGLSKYDDAVATFEHLIKLKPNNAEGYYGRGAAYATKGDWDKAKVDLDKAISIEPDAEKYEARAMVRYELKDKPGAYDDVETAIKTSPEEAGPYMLRGMLELSELKFGAAFKDYRTYKKYEKKKAKAEKKANK